MPRPIHFEVPADDPDRAAKFYSDVFGWKISKWDGPQEYWLISTGEGPGIDGGLLRRMHPSAGTVNTLGVDSLDDSVKTVEAHKANAMRKLDLNGRIDIVKYAVLQGWLHNA